MKIREMRDMDNEELNRNKLKLQEDLFRLRIRHAAGQLETPSVLGRTRKDIARIKTMLREREA
jgi:large subunit ribosomal protein L29